MPLPLPKLDSRTWEELVSEGRTLIPRRAPGWTDHNLHDPGITLMELFAWLAEMLLFRLDRVSPAAVRAFLRLVGVRPRPAGVAATAVAIRLPAGSAPLTLAPRTQVTDGQTTVFEAPAPLTVSPAWLDLQPAGVYRGQLRTRTKGQVFDQTAANATRGRLFWALGASPEPGSALEIGFDQLPAAPGSSLSLYMWTESWATDPALAGRIEQEWAEASAACTPPTPVPGPECEEIGLEPTPAPTPAPRPSGPPGWWFHYSARTIWEYASAGGSWLALEVATDATRALTLSGSIVLGIPADQAGDRAWAVSDGRYWLRCRLDRGTYECPPRLAAIAVNAMPVRHAATTSAEEWLGRSRGQAKQTYQLAKAPVVAGTTTLRLSLGSLVDDGWHEIIEWDDSGPADMQYRLDPLAGTVTFGDGRTGAVVPDGFDIWALSYQVGGGPAGNVPAGLLSGLVNPPMAGLEVAQPFPAVGGSPAETLDRAHGRALDDLAGPARGVTVTDLEALAMQTPSVPIARAKAWPAYHPSYPCLTVPGAVTVVVLPACGTPPRPGVDFLREVQLFLERRRPLTTNVQVVGPSYVKVMVTANLHVARNGATMAARNAQEALDQFFDPLEGGSDGKGWPFGRDVLSSEVLARLSAVPGVEFVDGLLIARADETGAHCLNLALCPTDLVDSQTHRFTVTEV